MFSGLVGYFFILSYVYLVDQSLNKVNHKENESAYYVIWIPFSLKADKRQASACLFA
jgi:hypothetical protein